MNDFRQWQEAVRLGYDINDKVKVSFTYRRLDSYFEYPTPYVDYNQWPSVPDPHLYNTEDKNRSNLVTGRVDAEISQAVVHQLHGGALQHGLFLPYSRI